MSGTPRWSPFPICLVVLDVNMQYCLKIVVWLRETTNGKQVKTDSAQVMGDSDAISWFLDWLIVEKCG